jgi:hypothetical protein
MCLKLKWSESQYDLLPDDYTVFSHIRDPIKRHFMGTAEYILQHNLVHLLEDKDWQRVWSSAVLDIHSYPITWSLPKYNSIHWIPIHDSLNTNKITIDFLNSRDVFVKEIKNMYESNDEKKLYYQKLLDIHTKLDPTSKISYFYDSDIVLWCKVFKEYINMQSYKYE